MIIPCRCATHDEEATGEDLLCEYCRWAKGAKDLVPCPLLSDEEYAEKVKRLQSA